MLHDHLLPNHPWAGKARKRKDVFLQKEAKTFALWVRGRGG
jgi:hypothetical protein